ncbi:hypothetical protein GQ53DRAFT_803651 [Thozetella sp. PMI_491]|nr:hypothetical protein GQ53DRAFT_803651 [Thozetella sp. PMI_491]
MAATATETRPQGVWSLLSFDLHLVANPTGPSVFQPLGSKVIGRVAIGADGYMAALLQSRDVVDAAQFESAGEKSWQRSPDADLARVARTAIVYSGWYRLYTENDESYLSTKVDFALDPSMIGGEQVRKWQVLEEDGRQLLILRPSQTFKLPNGAEVFGVVRWEKVENSA